jgi:hypothetical protein
MLWILKNGYFGGPLNANGRAIGARVMSVTKRIAYYQNRRDEVPNQELAQELARRSDKTGIQEICEGLRSNNNNIRSDCLKVLYEIGYLRPDLIAPYANELLSLLDDKHNRMVWGAMIGLGTIAKLSAKTIWPNIDKVLKAIDHGSLITLVWGIRTLSNAAAGSKTRTRKIIPKLTRYLQECNVRDVPTHLESMLPVIDRTNWKALAKIAEQRQKEMTPSHLARLKRVLKKLPVERKTIAEQ